LGMGEGVGWWSDLRLAGRFDSEPFADALMLAVALARDGDRLRLFYPESRENVLVFRRS
jgi:hypothetical protein